MKFGYTIIYVADVQATIQFYEEAFGFTTRFIHGEGDYAELETGETTLAFASLELAQSNFPSGYTKLTDLDHPPGIEIALVTHNIEQTVVKATKAGAMMILEPTVKPWGQTVAFLRAPDGSVIELCTPMNG